METKTCTKCGETKPIDGFYKRRKDSEERLGICKKCYTERYYPDQVAREQARGEGKTLAKDEATKLLELAKAGREAEREAKRKLAAANGPRLTKGEQAAAWGASTAPYITLAEQAQCQGKNGVAELAERKRAERTPVYRVSILKAGGTRPAVVRLQAEDEADAAGKALAMDPIAKYLGGVEAGAVMAVEVFYNEFQNKWGQPAELVA